MINNDSLRSIVIIPCCNNVKQLLSIMEDFTKVDVDAICIVVDCATKEQLEKLQQSAKKLVMPVFIKAQEKRMGIGFAIRAGIDFSFKGRYDIAVIMAGNGKDLPREIPRLLKPIITDGYDYIQGSRFLPGGRHVKTPIFRRIFSQLYPFIWTMFTEIRCTDVTNGFRAYRLSIFKNQKINIRQSWLDDYQLEYYIHYKALTLGYRIKEVPVSKIYPFSNKGGYSNIHPFRDWWKIVSPLIYLKLGVKH